MSLIIGVDSYVTLEEADAYHENMGNSAQWPGGASDDETIKKKEAALRKAASFIDLAASGRWRGRKAKAGQPHAWPRIDAYDGDGYLIPYNVIPRCVKNATCEAAFRIYDGEDLMPDETGRNVASESVAGAVTVSYFEGKSSATEYTRIYTMLDDVLVSPISSGAKIVFTTRGYEFF